MRGGSSVKFLGKELGDRRAVHTVVRYLPRGISEESVQDNLGWKSHLTTSRIRTSRAPAHIQLPHAFCCIFCNFHARGRWNFLPQRGACGRPSPGIRLIIISEEGKTQVQYPYLRTFPSLCRRQAPHPQTRAPTALLCTLPACLPTLPYLTLSLRTFPYSTTAYLPAISPKLKPLASLE